MMRKTFALAAVIAIFFILGTSVPAAPPILAMILDGQSGGTYHAWQQVTPVLKKQLEDTGLFHVDVVTAPAWPGDFSAFKPDFKKYQVVVSNLDSQDWPADLKASFENYVTNGGGFVSVHAADNAFPGWKAYNEMIGVGGWRGRNQNAGPLRFFKDGKLVSETTPGNAGAHGNRLPFQLQTREAEHPIMKGFPTLWQDFPDELYVIAKQWPNCVALGQGAGITNQENVCIWVNTYGKGRTFGTTLGHGNDTVESDVYLDLVTRGLVVTDGAPAIDSRYRLSERR